MTSNKFDYKDYVDDAAFLDSYNEYQKKYASTIRESDKKIISLVEGMIQQSGSARLRLLDIGCSTGNLLFHLKNRLGGKLELVGGDLALASLEICRQDPKLAGIDFAEMDILDLPSESFDIVLINCVLYMMADEQYAAALRSVCGALKPGGAVLIYDFAHEFPQEIEIIEKTASHPHGLRLCFRSTKAVGAAMKAAGFKSWTIEPFELPLDLPRIDDPKEIITYTRKDEHGTRMAFRGTLFQPWCHMVARKAG